jgi:hypothetical protein
MGYSKITEISGPVKGFDHLNQLGGKLPRNNSVLRNCVFWRYISIQIFFCLTMRLCVCVLYKVAYETRNFSIKQGTLSLCLQSTTSVRHMEKWWYGVVCSQSWNYIEMNNQPHATSALLQEGVIIADNKRYAIHTPWCSWLRHCATKVAGSITVVVIGIFHWPNPFSHTVALRSTQPLAERRTRDISRW